MIVEPQSARRQSSLPQSFRKIDRAWWQITSIVEGVDSINAVRYQCAFGVLDIGEQWTRIIVFNDNGVFQTEFRFGNKFIYSILEVNREIAERTAENSGDVFLDTEKLSTGR